MTDWSFLEQEVTKAILTGCVSVITLGVGWFVGLRISAVWALRQKRRELELSAASELYRLYGEFFAVWKLWNYFKLGIVSSEGKDIRWELMQRAALVDAGFEALLVKVASERVLAENICAELGLLRQGFQRLRESIKRNEPLGWSSSEHPEYREFKRLACLFSNLLAADHHWEQTQTSAADSALQEITSNKHEAAWRKLAARQKQREA